MRDRASLMPTILLLEEDDVTRPLLVNSLRDLGYRVLPAIDEESAIEWILSNPNSKLNVIVINQVKISRQECVETLDRIYRLTNLSRAIPSVIIAERYQAALEGTEEKIDDNKYIIYLENAEQLFTLLDRLCVNDNN
jgi:CheY-like chemotaxis protein